MITASTLKATMRMKAETTIIWMIVITKTREEIVKKVKGLTKYLKPKINNKMMTQKVLIPMISFSI